MLIAAVGMTLVIIARHIDISIGSQFAVCAVLAGMMAKAGFPMPVVAVLTLLIGAVMGAMNGALVSGLGLPSIVVTLATMVVFREVAAVVKPGPVRARFAGRVSVVWPLAARRAMDVAPDCFAGLRPIRMGIALDARRANGLCGRLRSGSGASCRHPTAPSGVFCLCAHGRLVGLAALLNAVRFSDVDPHLGTGWELTVIAAVVVGGAAISGGRGTLPGTLIGVALLATIGPALVFFSVPSQWEKAIQGLIILVAVASDGMYRRTA